MKCKKGWGKLELYDHEWASKECQTWPIWSVSSLFYVGSHKLPPIQSNRLFMTIWDFINNSRIITCEIAKWMRMLNANFTCYAQFSTTHTHIYFYGIGNVFNWSFVCLESEFVWSKNFGWMLRNYGNRYEKLYRFWNFQMGKFGDFSSILETFLMWKPSQMHE